MDAGETADTSAPGGRGRTAIEVSGRSDCRQPTRRQRADDGTRRQRRRCQPPRAVRLRPDPVHRHGDALYERHLMFDNVVDPADGRAARALRGRRPLGARRPLAALAAHRADLRPREPQARLLPLDGVPDRPLAGQQRHEPAPRPDRAAASSSEKQPRLARRCSRRSPTPAWATAGSAASRRASSTRWRRCSSRRWATGCATSTASSGRRSRTAGSTSSPTTGCAGPIPGRSRGRRRQVEVKLGCSFELRGGSLRAIVGRPSTPARHSVRSPGRRLRRQDDQHAAALGRGRAGRLRLPGVQRRRLRRARWPSGSRPSR